MHLCNVYFEIYLHLMFGYQPVKNEQFWQISTWQMSLYVKDILKYHYHENISQK